MSNLYIPMYHYVRDLKDSRYPEIKGLETRDFVKQLEFLLNGFTIVSPYEVIEAAYNRKSIPDNSCMLTFDDGYLDHYCTVFPLLKKYGISAFFSMPGRILNEKKLLDVNKIHYILASSEEKELWDMFKRTTERFLEEHELPSITEYWNNCNLASRFDSEEIVFIKRMLQVELPVHVRTSIVDILYNEFVNVPEATMVKELYMDTNQMKLMKDSGMVFGIHGYEHAWLNRMTHEQADNDINNALKAMEGIVDKEGWIICYPYGSYSKEVEQIAKKYGAVLGITTECRIAVLGSDNIFALPRYDTNDFPPKSYNYLNYSK